MPNVAEIHHHPVLNPVRAFAEYLQVRSIIGGIGLTGLDFKRIELAVVGQQQIDLKPALIAEEIKIGTGTYRRCHIKKILSSFEAEQAESEMKIFRANSLSSGGRIKLRPGGQASKKKRE